MSLSGIAGIEQRIAAIQAQVATYTSTTVTSTTSTSTTSGSSFDAVLASAMDEAATTTSTAVNADGVPVALAAYGNGNIPASALEEVGSTGHRLWAPAAESLEQLIADAAQDGVTIGITDSYRSYEAQVDVAERKGLYSEGGLAAVPGTSDHGWGLAVDLDLDDAAQSWMRANGSRYGFEEDTPREPWHWAYQV
ncbi:MAG TPA: M15 family metallopeptidase [Cellulomonas sp.]